MKLLFTTLFALFSLLAFAQRTVTLTEDMVMTETMVITEDVTYIGNGHRMICEGCQPAIEVTNGATVHFENVYFPKSYHGWLSVSLGATVSWDSPKMRGSVSSTRRAR